MPNQTKEHKYFVHGMHCPSCEILIEKRLLELSNVKSVDASTGKGEVLIEYENEQPSVNHLNEIFKKSGYTFSENKFAIEEKQKSQGLIFAFGIGLLIIAAFVLLNSLGLSGLINVSAKSSLPVFFIFGIIAGISSCAALVGGIILSMSKQWSELYSTEDSTWKKLQPHLLFNIGRLVSYGLLGALLGAIGSKLNLTIKFGPALVIIVSIIMLFLALQMLGVKAFKRFQFSMPKVFTRSIANESNFKGKYMPFVMGALTFFLPCGFTITAQSLALISGNALQGGMIMALFALGTLPTLFLIGLSSVKMTNKVGRSEKFLKVAGVVVLFFALFNINSQLNVLGLPSFNDLSQSPASATTTNNIPGLAPIVDGKQILRMNASTSGYSPSYFKVLAGIPVRWEIADTGTSGCTNAVIAKSLFSGNIPLTPGQTSVKEFTPTTVGRYKFSCWMGMISGMIDVVDESGATVSTASGASSSSGTCTLAGGCTGN